MTGKTKAPKKDPWRPTIVIDPRQVEALAGLWLFDRIKNDPEIEAAWVRGRAKVQATTMQGLIQSAKSGNVRALMFLAERICGLKETVVHEGEVTSRYVVELPAEVPARDWQATFAPNTTGHTVN
jgi:hypothetical protein